MSQLDALGKYGFVETGPSFADLINFASKSYTYEVVSTPSAEDTNPTHWLPTSITATLRNGEQYIKSLTYDAYGELSTESRWEYFTPPIVSSASLWFLWPWIPGNDVIVSHNQRSMWAMWPWL